MSKVKICGLSRIADIEAVNAALPDYIGFVFAPSRRRVSACDASMLKGRLDKRIKAVGVFVDADIETVAALFRGGVIDLAQLHGDEDESYIGQLKQLCGCPVIKAIGIGTMGGPGDTIMKAGTAHLYRNADYLLFDTLSKQRGGTGEVFDWGLLEGFGMKPYFLAGGLNPENAGEAISRLAPYCVDVSSGVEAGGAKDAGKIHEFVRIARGL